MPQVIVIPSVWRGVVQDVFYSHPKVQVTLVDGDVEESYPDVPGIVEIDTDASCLARAYVADIAINSQADIAGIDVELAIHAAQRRHLTP